MDLGDVDSSLNVLVIGAESVGKSSLISVLCRGSFNPTYKKTIGTDFKEHNLTLEGQDMDTNMMIWEVGGGANPFSATNSRYIKEASGILIVFSTDDRASFEQAIALQQKIAQERPNGVLVVLVQNKVDLIDNAAVEAKEVEAAAQDMLVKLYRTSCHDPALVSQVFQFLGQKLTGTSANLTDIGDIQSTRPVENIQASESLGDASSSQIKTNSGNSSDDVLNNATTTGNPEEHATIAPEKPETTSTTSADANQAQETLEPPIASIVPSKQRGAKTSCCVCM
mmetsp:Transcript_13914/g.25759  ORF Transcript_13914/g.25759 Transcript_13914/m.25759 type:complete len:282 (+) Transcript_13914:129-974(+)